MKECIIFIDNLFVVPFKLKIMQYVKNIHCLRI